MDLDESVNCAACGYDLTGVGWEGCCPECGGYYDKSNARGIVRGGRGSMTPHERGDWVVAVVKVVAYAVLGVACLLWGGIASLSSPMPGRPLVLGLLAGAAFGFAAYATWFIDRRGG